MCRRYCMLQSRKGDYLILDNLILKYGTKTMKIQALKNMIDFEIKSHEVKVKRIIRMQRLLAKWENREVSNV